MTTYSFRITERFSAQPGDVRALATDAARWREWAGPLLSRFRWPPVAEHEYTMLPTWPLRCRPGKSRTTRFRHPLWATRAR